MMKMMIRHTCNLKVTVASNRVAYLKQIRAPPTTLILGLYIIILWMLYNIPFLHLSIEILTIYNNE